MAECVRIDLGDEMVLAVLQRLVDIAEAHAAPIVVPGQGQPIGPDLIRKTGQQKSLAALGQGAAHVAQQHQSAVIGTADAMTIKDDERGIVRISRDPAQQLLGGREVKSALQLVDEDTPARCIEHLSLARRAQALRRHRAAAVAAAHDVVGGELHVVDVQLEALRQLLADFDAAVAVAMRVKQRRDRFRIRTGPAARQ